MIKFFSKIFSKRFIIQFLKFALVGALGTLINLGILYCFTEFFKVYYLISEIFAFVIVSINNYLLDKVWTFKEEVREQVVIKYFQFFTISVIALMINLIFLFILVEYFHLWYIFAEIFAIGCAFLINFSGNRYFTFKQKNKIKLQNQK